MKKLTLTALLAAIMLLGVIGCSDEDNPVDPLANFQPEIVNNTDNFEFQATDVDNITGVVLYDWQNTGTIASVDHSSAVTSGTADITVYDGNYNVVYQSGLSASLNENTDQGNSGTWHVKVELNGMSGTLNFRLQKYDNTPM